MYKDSIVPEHHPGGGGFGVMQYTLDNLFDMHEKCNNWWTASNEHLPLCKYIGCKLKIYQSETTDFVLKIQNTQPFLSNKLTYPSCQPSMLLMSSHKVIMPSKLTTTLPKPYKTKWIPPPPQFQNRWYFQKDVCKLPLMVLHAAPVSLYHYYTQTDNENNNISITHLNTQLINNHAWGDNRYKNNHWPYKILGTQIYYFYRYMGTESNSSNFKLKQICPLTNIQIAQEGWTYEELRGKTDWSDYKSNLLKYSGNIFQKTHIEHSGEIYYSTRSPENIFTTTAQEDSTLATGEQHERAFTQLTDPLVTYTRYNPNTDTGQHTVMYLLKNNKFELTPNWEPPNDEDQILRGFPIWLNIFGFVDFQKKLAKLLDIDKSSILCFKTDKTIPKYSHVFVPLDLNFINDKSPYENTINNTDKEAWYPKVQFQTEQINNITKCGPGITKMGDRKSEELKVKYSFKFLWGGAPPKMITVDNPTEQIMYPIPRNNNETTSLQSPTSNFETLLYTFDQRNYQLTQQALKRIQQDWATKSTLSSITEPTTDVPIQQTLQALLQETQTEEESQETLLQQLQFHKQQQLQLKHRIMDLIQQMSLNSNV